MTVAESLSKILNADFQIKLNRILTDFVMESNEDISEEKQDFVFSDCEEKILYLVEETFDKIKEVQQHNGNKS